MSKKKNKVYVSVTGSVYHGTKLAINATYGNYEIKRRDKKIGEYIQYVTWYCDNYEPVPYLDRNNVRKFTYAIRVLREDKDGCEYWGKSLAKNFPVIDTDIKKFLASHGKMSSEKPVQCHHFAVETVSQYQREKRDIRDRGLKHHAQFDPAQKYNPASLALSGMREYDDNFMRGVSDTVAAYIPANELGHPAQPKHHDSNMGGYDAHNKVESHYIDVYGVVHHKYGDLAPVTEKIEKKAWY